MLDTVALQAFYPLKTVKLEIIAYFRDYLNNYLKIREN